jgi:xanthosine utilization system XapX-like protein
LQDPWRRLLAQHRIEAACDSAGVRRRRRPSPLALAAVGWVGAVVGFQLHPSQWWALPLVASTVGASVAAVDVVRRRTTLVHAVALMAASDPHPAPLAQGTLVEALCALSGHHRGRLDAALRRTAPTDLARVPLTEAKVRCRSRATEEGKEAP